MKRVVLPLTEEMKAAAATCRLTGQRRPFLQAVSAHTGFPNSAWVECPACDGTGPEGSSCRVCLATIGAVYAPESFVHPGLLHVGRLRRALGWR